MKITIRNVYTGWAIDRLQRYPSRKTKGYDTYEAAHKAAERLCKKWFGDRGRVDVEY